MCGSSLRMGCTGEDSRFPVIPSNSPHAVVQIDLGCLELLPHAAVPTRASLEDSVPRDLSV